MLIIPEVQSIFIFPPRTGSSTLAMQLAEHFPRSVLLYRHMEADGVPEGYSSYRRVGFVRHPMARLWSLFKYCATLNTNEALVKWVPLEVERATKSVQGKSFEEWVLTNEETFLPTNTDLPYLYQRHHIPETRKSCAVYLRPDIEGINILHYQDMARHMKSMGLDPEARLSATPALPVPEVTKALRKHLKRYFPWEMSLKLSVV